MLISKLFYCKARDITSLVYGTCRLSGIFYLLWAMLAKNVVNLNIKKEDSKVVNTFDIEDIGEKKVYCRCWRSAIFPLCDGSHNKHNETTGDNVGPLIIAKKSN
nr:EOG090X0JRY [Simocephalus serrulatus]